MLDVRYRFGKTEYDLALKRDADWSESENRVLIVIETISSIDLKNGELLSTPDTKVPMLSVIKFAQRDLVHYGEESLKKRFSYAVFNFRTEKHLQLSTEQRVAKEVEFATRVQRAIQKMKPTHILFCGFNAFSKCCPCDNPSYHLGWVETRKFGTHECKTTYTFDVFHLMEKNGEHSNQLRTVAYHLSFLLNGVHPFSLEHVQPKPHYVSSVKEFNSMMNVMKSSKLVAFDSETKNLSVSANAIYTIQLASDKSDVGYVLSLDHPQTPWNAKQIDYFKEKLREFLSTYEGPTLVTMNGKFDLRVLRQVLKLPIIRRKLWEITAGEHLLNEDMSSFIDLNNKTAYGNLRAILCSYQNDFYFRNKFTKEDRSTTGETPPNDPSFLRYASMDVCCLIPILRMQCKRASMQTIAGKPYKPYFIRHMLYEMGDTEHVLSHLDECGSFIDMEYMRLLASAHSPFADQLREIKEELYAQPEVQKANSLLLKESGFKAISLFGNSSANSWIFNLGKPAHRICLFLDVLKLKCTTMTPSGAPSIGKLFIKEYKNTNRIVELYGKYQEVYKIYTSYIKSWYKMLLSQDDAYLRPSYGFWDVATGRISSRKPSLQVIPQHSKSAKIFKRAFVAPKGKFLIRYDYSAHEVRGWSIVSGDMTLANAFREGQKLRQEWIQNPTDEIKKAMKTRGDIHVQNVYRFFGKWVDKSDPLRQAVKATTFGTIYSSSAKSIGEQTKTADMGALGSELSEAYHELLQVKKEMKNRGMRDA